MPSLGGVLKIKRRWLVVLADVAIASAAVPAAFMLRGNLSLDDLPADAIGPAMLLAVIAAVLAFSMTGTHRALWRYVTVRDLGALLAGATVAVLGFVALMFLWDRLASVPRTVPLLQWLLVVVGLCGARLCYAAVTGLRVQRVSPPVRIQWEPVLLVGGGDGAAVVARLLQMVPEAGWRAVGILDQELTVGRMIDNVPILGRLDDFRRVLARLSVHGMRPQRIIVTAGHDEIGRDAIWRLQKAAYAERLPISDVQELMRLPPVVGVRRPVPAGLKDALARIEQQSYLGTKRLFDIACSLAGLILAAPLLLFIAVALYLSIGAPVTFHQLRGGHGGVPFVLYKFRTMRDLFGADDQLLADALRLTWIGRFLRRTRLDELPQLWNVLKGDMSIIGPRPLIERELAELADGGAERSMVHPGLTGWAQVHGGQLLGPDAKLALDLWYVRNASVWLDLRILLLTVRMVVLGERVDPGVVEQAKATLASAA